MSGDDVELCEMAKAALIRAYRSKIPITCTKIRVIFVEEEGAVIKLYNKYGYLHNIVLNYQDIFSALIIYANDLFKAATGYGFEMMKNEFLNGEKNERYL